MPLTYDLDIAATKFCHGLADGEIPLLLLFAGTVYYQGDTGVQVGPVPWSEEATFRLPVATWRAAMDDHYPGSTFIRLSPATLDALSAYRSKHVITTWDETLERLLKEAPVNRRVGTVVGPRPPWSRVADAVLFEGYLLYPYRASAQKNRLRWQFGVLTPATDGTEPTRSRTEVLLEPKPGCVLRIRLRFLQLQAPHPARRRPAVLPVRGGRAAAGRRRGGARRPAADDPRRAARVESEDRTAPLPARVLGACAGGWSSRPSTCPAPTSCTGCASTSSTTACARRGRRARRCCARR